MNNYTFNKDGFTFRRVPKNKARAAYNNGLSVVFSPCNMRPFNNFFGLDMVMNKANINCDGVPFEKLLNEYEFYNCNGETGRYTSFYIPVITVDRFTGEAAPVGIEQYDYKFLEV